MTESDFLVEASPPVEDFPWPPREGASILDSLATTWKESVFHPIRFFRRMPIEFDFGWVLGYYLILGIVTGGISLFWEMVLGPSVAERWLPEGAFAAAQNPIVDFLLSPLFLVMALFIAAGVVHLFLLVMRGAKNEYGTTLRVFCYSVGPQLFVIVPFVGGVAGGLWSLIITVIGLREAHQTSNTKALLAVLLPLAFLAFFAILLVAMGTLMGLGLGQAAG